MVTKDPITSQKSRLIHYIAKLSIFKNCTRPVGH